VSELDHNIEQLCIRDATSPHFVKSESCMSRVESESYCDELGSPSPAGCNPSPDVCGSSPWNGSYDSLLGKMHYNLRAMCV